MREHAHRTNTHKHEGHGYADWSIPLLQLLKRRNGDIFKSNSSTNLFLTTNLSADCFSPPGGKVYTGLEATGEQKRDEPPARRGCENETVEFKISIPPHDWVVLKF